MAASGWRATLIALCAAAPARLAEPPECAQSPRHTSKHIAIGDWRVRNRTLAAALIDWRSEGHQCAGARDTPGGARFRFQPARLWGTTGPGPGVVVAVVAGGGTGTAGARGKSNRADGLRNKLRGWHRHMLQPFNLTLLLLVARRYTVEDEAGAHEYASSLGLQRTPCDAFPACVACARLRAIDEGYAHYTFRTTERPRPSHVLVGVVTLHDPAWVRALPPGQSLRQWHSARCNHMYYLYILSNNYYVHHLFRLRVLDLFDFFLKVDTDVAVTARLPASPAAQMWRARSFFMHTAWPHHDDAECTGNLSDMVDAYVRAESGRCARRLRPAAEPSAWWRDDELGFTGNFLGGWLGFFASAQVLHFSHHWYAYGPHGQWYWRWTDQQYWHKALGLVDRGPERWVDNSAWRNDVFCHKKCHFTFPQLRCDESDCWREPAAAGQRGPAAQGGAARGGVARDGAGGGIGARVRGARGAAGAADREARVAQREARRQRRARRDGGRALATADLLPTATRPRRAPRALGVAASAEVRAEPAGAAQPERVFIYGLAPPQMAAQLLRLAALVEAGARVGARVAEPYVHANARACLLRGWPVGAGGGGGLNASGAARAEAGGPGADGAEPPLPPVSFPLGALYSLDTAAAAFSAAARPLLPAAATRLLPPAAAGVGRADGAAAARAWRGGAAADAAGARAEWAALTLRIDVAICRAEPTAGGDDAAAAGAPDGGGGGGPGRIRKIKKHGHLKKGGPGRDGTAERRAERDDAAQGEGLPRVKRRLRTSAAVLADGAADRAAEGAPGGADASPAAAANVGAAGPASEACFSAMGRAEGLCRFALADLRAQSGGRASISRVLCIARDEAHDLPRLLGSTGALRSARTILWLNPHRDLFGKAVERRAWGTLLGVPAHKRAPAVPPAIMPSALVRALARAVARAHFRSGAPGRMSSDDDEDDYSDFVGIHFRLERMGCKASAPTSARCAELHACTARALALAEQLRASLGMRHAVLFSDLSAGGSLSCDTHAAGGCGASCCAHLAPGLLARARAHRMLSGGGAPSWEVAWRAVAAQPQLRGTAAALMRTRLAPSLLDAALMSLGRARVHVGGGQFGFWVTALQRSLPMDAGGTAGADARADAELRATAAIEPLLAAIRNASSCRRVVVSYRPARAGT